MSIATIGGRERKNCQGVPEQGGEGGREKKKDNCKSFPRYTEIKLTLNGNKDWKACIL